MNSERPIWEKYLVVKESGVHGKGIFSLIDIPEDEIIMIIEGEVISEDECVRREEEENNVYIFWNGDNYIDCEKSELIKYLNHLCEPNCYIEEKDNSSLYLITSSAIKAGEEITIDYAYEEIYETCTCPACSSEGNRKAGKK
jgi:SET domain-containing protein